MQNDKSSQAAKAPIACVTLWRCPRCSSFISVESFTSVQLTVCPACNNTQVNLCGSFDHVLELRTEDDTCCDYYPNGWGAES